MTVTLINRSGRCLALNLPHRFVCVPLIADGGTCLCTPPQDPRGRAVCRSITLPAGHAAAALPEAVLAAPEVLAAARRGDLEVHKKEPKPPAEPPRSPKSGSRDKRARRKRGGSR